LDLADPISNASIRANASSSTRRSTDRNDRIVCTDAIYGIDRIDLADPTASAAIRANVC
jgi:hypothetical protein